MKVFPQLSILLLGVILLFSCSELLNTEPEEELADPVVDLVKLPGIITNVDTIIFSVENPEGLSKIAVSLVGEYKTYNFEITSQPYYIILSASDFVSGEYDLYYDVYNSKQNTVSFASYGNAVSIANPMESDLTIFPMQVGNFDNVWVLIEDTERNTLHYGLMESSYYQVKFTDGERPANNTYNIHFIFEDYPESQDGNYAHISRIELKSFYNFTGNLYKPKQYYQPSYGWWGQKFRFLNIPEYDYNYVGHPYIHSNYFEGLFETIFTDLENDVFVYTKLNDYYYTKYFQNLSKSDSLLDLSDMEKAANLHTINLKGTEPSIEVSYLSEKERIMPYVPIANIKSTSDTTVVLPMIDAFTSDPFFESVVSFQPINDMLHTYTYVGQIPTNVETKNVEFDFVLDSNTTEISTTSDFDYMHGTRSFSSNGEVVWGFITNTNSVTLPNFPEELYDDIPELEKFATKNYHLGYSRISIVDYTNFTNYQDLLNNFDPKRFEPVDNGEYTIFDYCRLIKYY